MGDGHAAPNQGFDGYREYFVGKQRLQKAQEEQLRGVCGARTPIFRGCRVHVNGHTDPDREELRREIVMHGGTFVHYLARPSDVTHIVAEHVPVAKRRLWHACKVVRPAWVSACLCSGELVPWKPYAAAGTEAAATIMASVGSPQGPRLTCKDPGFIEDFFAKSRLHHLSAWKAALRERFLDRHLRMNEGALNDLRAPPAHVLHVDFDCFFATISGIKAGYPSKAEVPLAVCHGGSSSDVASCNYAARECGIQNGMWVSKAKNLCPQLVCLPYTYDEYETISNAFYEVLEGLKAFDAVYPISVDEAVCVIDMPLDTLSCQNLCIRIRSEVAERTGGCSVSVGCAPSLVLARLALKRAKPDGYLVCTKESIKGGDTQVVSPAHLFETCALRDLPGVGRAIAEKLLLGSTGHEHTIAQVSQLFSRSELIARLGSITGAKLADLFQGLDDVESSRMLCNPRAYFARKSLSVEINWGIRFDAVPEVDAFLDRLVQYLVGKLNELRMTTSHIVLKIARRSRDAPIEPPKYLGMGDCDSYSKSCRLGLATNIPGVISAEIKAAFRMLCCPAKELRGIAVQFLKLKEASISQMPRQLRFPFGTIRPLTTPKNRITASVTELPPVVYKRATPIKDFFDRHKRTSSSPSPDFTHMMSASALCESFLGGLPTDLAEEIRREHRIYQKARRSYLQSSRKRIGAGAHGNKSDHALKNLGILEPVTFQNLISQEKIKSLVREWISQTLRSDGPNHKDLDLFTNYLDRLISGGPRRLPTLLSMARLISDQLRIHEAQGDRPSFQEWEEYLVRVVLVRLNRCKQLYTQNVEILFDIYPQIDRP
ncbi:ADR369Cp [Eremothecium gossypii ATCC 10895]|uniref:DNA repair protein REV1 n=1 Tax=Eremothecium gossypii (strain ATCC 10895 / CBS 109.51 / FGSC 9923 / NRRL Y-1056) TaxID=284811 RepID=Q759A8_EREGS|nr:ADR369Cp [Eremothecium gossypii ATCC 10895]AAS52289.1 ADR369Cp [Eremothecium gossypii ATCC 10895]AEY96587.1 FADR369Cp [Eremothecium gossypii FDAG1]